MVLRQPHLITYTKQIHFNLKVSETLSRPEQPTAVGKVFYLLENFFIPLNPSHPQRLGISYLWLADSNDVLRLSKQRLAWHFQFLIAVIRFHLSSVPFSNCLFHSLMAALQPHLCAEPPPAAILSSAGSEAVLTTDGLPIPVLWDMVSDKGSCRDGPGTMCWPWLPPNGFILHCLWWRLLWVFIRCLTLLTSYWL